MNNSKKKNPKNTKKAQSHKTLKNQILLYAGIALAGLLTAALVFSGLYLKQYQSVFLPGVAIADTQVGGLSAEAAANRILFSADLWSQKPLTFYYEDKTYPVTMADLLSAESCENQVEAIWQREQKKNWLKKTISLLLKQEQAYSLALDYTAESFQNTIEAWRKDWNREAQDAHFTFNGKGFSIEEEQVGLVVDVEATLAQLPPTLEQAIGQKYQLMMQQDLPAVTAADFENMGEIASYSTNYNPGEISRTHNLTQAVNKVNGTILKPGEEFSFNNRVGIREAATGYRDAMVIVNGKYEPGLGGGICQVSSTLYNVALLTGLKIVERHNHALAVAYVPVGRDATVVYGVQDFRFANTTEDLLYIAAQASQGKLSIAFYGNMANRKSISITNPIDQVIPFKDIQQTDDTLPPGTEKLDHNGSNGYIVRTYRNYLDATGNVIQSEFLAKDSYLPLNRLTLLGPEVEIEMTDPENHELNTDPIPETNHGAEAESDDNSADEAIPVEETPEEDLAKEENTSQPPLETIQPVDIIDPPQIGL